MPSPDRIEIISVGLICEDVFQMPLQEFVMDYTLKLLLKSTMGGGGDA